MGHIVQFDPTKSPRHQKPEPPLRNVFGSIFKEARLKRGERLIEVARRAAVSVQYLSEIERGRKDASSEVFANVARALDMSMVDLTSSAAQRFSAGPQNNAVSNMVRLAA